MEPFVIVYALFDRRLREYGQLVTAKNEDTVKRYIVDGIQPGSFMAKNAVDYDLYEIGVFEPETGKLEGVMPPKLVVNVKELLDVWHGSEPEVRRG